MKRDDRLRHGSLVVDAALSLPPVARAQPAANAVAAEELFRKGRDLLEQKRYAEACPKLEASQKLDPAVGTQYSLGQCYEGESRLASAWFAYRGAAAVAAQKGDRRRVTAQKSADAIESHLAHLAVTLAPAQGPIEVSIDGDRIAPEVLVYPLFRSTPASITSRRRGAPCGIRSSTSRRMT